MTPRISLVLLVSDLAAERAFYRDVVGLGEPVMNSNVWVEFRLDGGASFCLEQAAPNKPPLPPAQPHRIPVFHRLAGGI